MFLGARFFLAAALLFISVGMAEGVPIPESSKVDLPPGALAGLDGFYYNTNVTSTAQADAFIANNSPTATFLSTLLDYPAKAANTVADTKTLSAFLGADSASLSGFGANTLDSSLFLFTGFIQIATPGDVNFALGSDDGMALRIGGVTVTQYDGARSFGFSTGTASFSSAGYYPVEILYWENSGNTGIEWYGSIPGGPNYGAPTGTVGIVPTAVLFDPVPEPSTLLLLGSGLLGLGGVAWRRRRKS
jgi:hypothetical protein